jgi:hypothetical protein
MTKKLLIVGMIFLAAFAVQALAQTWHTANQTTVGWDAVTTLSDGSAIPSGDVVKYEVWIANAKTDPNKTNPTLVAEVENLQETITLNVEGHYFVGIKARRYIVNPDSTQELVGESTVSWSDDPTKAANGEDFGIRYFLPPAAAVGLRPVSN